MIRHGAPCPFCRTPLLENVYQVRCQQSDFTQREKVIDRRCPAGCNKTRSDQWNDVMRALYPDD